MKYKTKEHQNNFTEKLKKITKEKNISQREICDALNFSQSTVSGWYTGVAIPKYDKLKPLSDFLGVDMSYWTDEDQEEPKGYYVDPETAILAEKLRTDKDLKLLFSEAATASPDDLKATYLMLKALKDKEQNTGD